LILLPEVAKSLNSEKNLRIKNPTTGGWDEELLRENSGPWMCTAFYGYRCQTMISLTSLHGIPTKQVASLLNRHTIWSGGWIIGEEHRDMMPLIDRPSPHEV
jgi:hypothetical protein